MFPFALPCFAPTAASQVLVFFPVPFVPLFLTFVLPALCFLSSAFGFPDPATQLSRSSFPLLPKLTLRRILFGALRFFRRFGFHGSLRLVSHPLFTISAYLVLCLVSFRPSQLHSRSRSVGACLCFLLRFLCFFFRHSSFAFRSLSVPSALGSDYSAFCFFRSLLPRFPSQWFFPVPSASLSFVRSASLTASRSGCFHPLLSALVLGFPAIPVRPHISHHRCYLCAYHLCSASFRPLPFRLLPLSLRFSFVFWAVRMHPQN